MRENPRHRLVDLHEDMERYPESSHEEFQNYTYTPSPWVENSRFPCSSNELWLLFEDPEECGTSKDLNESLPVRCGDPDRSRIDAWGVHMEQEYSANLMIIPVLIIDCLTLAGALWYMPFWLENHPGDLQNATVPVFLGMAIVGFLLHLPISFICSRWTR